MGSEQWYMEHPKPLGAPMWDSKRDFALATGYALRHLQRESLIIQEHEGCVPLSDGESSLVTGRFSSPGVNNIEPDASSVVQIIVETPDLPCNGELDVYLFERQPIEPVVGLREAKQTPTRSETLGATFKVSHETN